MPQVGAVVAAAVVKYAVGFSISKFLISTAASFVLSAVSRALTPKPKKPSLSFQNTSSGFTQTVREPLSTHKVVYGQTRVGGTLVFAGGTGSDNKHLHYVIVLAPHEVESIDEVWVNDYVIPNDWLNSSGVVNQGRYDGKIRILKYLGGSGQTASSELVTEVSEWSTDHKLQGLAYIYIRMEYDQDKFPSGIPAFSAFVKGKKIFDPRSGSSKFTSNCTLFQYDYLSNTDYGLGESTSIDTDIVSASANISDEMVSVQTIDYSITSVSSSSDILTIDGATLDLVLGDRVQFTTSGSLPSGISALTNYYIVPYQFKDTPRVRIASSLQNAIDNVYVDITSTGSGTLTMTKNAEPRYHGGGVIDTENDPETNMLDLLSGNGGKAIYVGGKWLLKAAAYSSPSVTLTEDDFIDQIVIQTRLTRRDRFNIIKGVYRGPLNYDQPSDWPTLRSQSFIDADNGEEIPRDYPTPFTQRPQNARRIAKIELLRARQEIVVRAVCNLRAMQVQCGDTIMITFEKYGWSEKIFEVTNFTLTGREENGVVSYGVELILRETDSTIYDWSTSEEQSIDPAPNTSLPNPYDISAVSGLSFDSRAVTTLGSDTFYILGMSWTSHNDSFVTNGGQFEIQFKLTSATDWNPSFFVAGNLNSTTNIATASAGTQYDVRIRAVNALGVRSAWVSLLGVTAGSGGGIISTEDWGDFVTSPSTSEDWEDFITSPSTSDDWGSYV